MTPVRIVLGGGFLAAYLEGGGHWSAFLQYLLGLRALGHDAFWLEVLTATGDRGRDLVGVDGFMRRMGEHGFAGRCAVLVVPSGPPVHDLATAEPFGLTRTQIADLAWSADLLWNFASAIRPPLLDAFRQRVLVDLDPGHLQVAALDVDMALADHDGFLTVGTRLDDPDCEVPTLGVRWHTFLPPVFLPAWSVAPDPGPGAPIASITQWTWEQLWIGERVLSVSKRDAYLRYLELPLRTGRPFELAANIHPDDDSGDRERLLAHGWRLVHPHDVVATPRAYRDYIHRARAELACPKPIHAALGTGWVSDRSAAFLASGRPVAFEDTGLGDRLPAGKGLLLFRNLAEAVEAVAEIDAGYPAHARAARELAEEYLDTGRVLPGMLEASWG